MASLPEGSVTSNPSTLTVIGPEYSVRASPRNTAFKKDVGSGGIVW